MDTSNADPANPTSIRIVTASTRSGGVYGTAGRPAGRRHCLLAASDVKHYGTAPTTGPIRTLLSRRGL